MCPTYEYECNECGYIFDKVHGMKETPPVKCPDCKGKAEKNICQNIGFKFKGAGFHCTDYPSNNQKK